MKRSFPDLRPAFMTPLTHPDVVNYPCVMVKLIQIQSDVLTLSYRHTSDPLLTVFYLSSVQTLKEHWYSLRVVFSFNNQVKRHPPKMPYVAAKSSHLIQAKGIYLGSASLNVVLLGWSSIAAHREGHCASWSTAAVNWILKNCDYSVGSHPEGGSITWSQEILHKAPIISAQ